MKKRNIILLIVLVVVIAIVTIVGFFAHKNWNTISTMYYVATGRESELEKKRIETDQRADEAIKDLGLEDVRPLTDEESKRLNSGEMSKEDALDIILGRNKDEADVDKNTQSENPVEASGSTSETTSKSPSGSTSEQTSGSNSDEKTTSATNAAEGKKESVDVMNSQNSDKSEQNKTPGISKETNNENKEENTSNTTPDENPSEDNKQSEEIKAKNDEIAQLIGEMYVLKAQFSSDLAGIEDWVKDQYWIYTVEYGEGNVPSSIKTKIGKSAYSKATALETECDSRVNSILAKITTLLEETGQSTTVVSEIRAAYDNEKMLAKSYYMGQI